MYYVPPGYAKLATAIEYLGKETVLSAIITYSSDDDLAQFAEWLCKDYDLDDILEDEDESEE